jgi:hypothetical protein
VPPGGESQGDGGKPPGDDWIPKTQFLAALRSATSQTEALAKEVRELKAAQEVKAAPKPPTRAELLSLVGVGDLTQEQADAIWEKQIVERAKREAAAEVGQVNGAQARKHKVESELQGYKELVPAAWEEGSPERLKAAKEFKHLVDLGDPSDTATEAKALRAAFGDLETLRASKSARTGSAETHSETGGGKPADGKSSALKLDERQKKHYGHLIEQGVYADWDAVKAELKAAPRRKAR